MCTRLLICYQVIYVCVSFNVAVCMCVQVCIIINEYYICNCLMPTRVLDCKIKSVPYSSYIFQYTKNSIFYVFHIAFQR